MLSNTCSAELESQIRVPALESLEGHGAKASAAAAGVSSAAANASTQPPATCPDHTHPMGPQRE